MSIKKQVLLGSGGHAGVLINAIPINELQLTDIVSPQLDIERWAHLNAEYHCSDEWVLSQCSHQVELINGLGSLPRTTNRLDMFNYFKAHGFVFKSIFDSSAIIAKNSILHEGVQVLAGSIIQNNATIEANTIINTGAIVEHDCFVGQHSHIAPGAILCGGVTIAQQVHVGCGSRILQSLKIGKGAIIAAGAVITKDVPEHVIAYTHKFEPIN